MINEESEIVHAPLVSVLMPCYNHEKYVINSLESVASSDYKLIELIFIDDASKDDSFNLAKKWFENNKRRFVRSVCIRHEINRGICATFNELYKHSRGEYISYLASDDLLLVNAISKQVSFSQGGRVDFVFSDCLLIDESGKLVSESALQYFGKNSQKLKRKTCLTTDIITSWEVPWNKFFMRSSLVEKIGCFDESLCFEDRDFIIRVLLSGSYEFMPDATTAYRIRLKNRTAPGLQGKLITSDFRKADCKNYLISSGLIKLLMGIVVYSYPMRYSQLGINNTALIWLVSRVIFLLRGFVMILHKIFIR